jgi:hypothetical protein
MDAMVPDKRRSKRKVPGRWWCLRRVPQAKEVEMVLGDRRQAIDEERKREAGKMKGGE